MPLVHNADTENKTCKSYLIDISNHVTLRTKQWFSFR